MASPGVAWGRRPDSDTRFKIFRRLVVHPAEALRRRFFKASTAVPTRLVPGVGMLEDYVKRKQTAVRTLQSVPLDKGYLGRQAFPAKAVRHGCRRSSADFVHRARIFIKSLDTAGIALKNLDSRGRGARSVGLNEIFAANGERRKRRSPIPGIENLCLPLSTLPLPNRRSRGLRELNHLCHFHCL